MKMGDPLNKRRGGNGISTKAALLRPCVWTMECTNGSKPLKEMKGDKD